MNAHSTRGRKHETASGPIAPSRRTGYWWLVGAAAVCAVVWVEEGVGGGVAVVGEFGDGDAEADAGGVAVAFEEAVVVDGVAGGLLAGGVDGVGGAAAVDVVVFDAEVGVGVAGVHDDAAGGAA